MENKFRNEMEITLGGEKILLRPTFENIQAMEAAMGGLFYLSMKYGKGVDEKTPMIEKAQSMPSVSESVQIFFFNQAEKKFSMEQIFELCMAEGLIVPRLAMEFFVRIAVGNKFQPDISETEKKS